MSRDTAHRSDSKQPKHTNATQPKCLPSRLTLSRTLDTIDLFYNDTLMRRYFNGD